jgi:hypothetical protein
MSDPRERFDTVHTVLSETEACAIVRAHPSRGRSWVSVCGTSSLFVATFGPSRPPSHSGRACSRKADPIASVLRLLHPCFVICNGSARTAADLRCYIKKSPVTHLYALLFDPGRTRDLTISHSEAAQCRHSCGLSTNCDYRGAVSATNRSSLKPRRRMKMGKPFTKTAMLEG